MNIRVSLYASILFAQLSFAQLNASEQLIGNDIVNLSVPQAANNSPSHFCNSGNLFFSSFENHSAEVVCSVHVFILAGQSNMTGYGKVEGIDDTVKGTLEYYFDEAEKEQSDQFQHLQDGQGNWRTRKDVLIRYNHVNQNSKVAELEYGGLRVGFTEHSNNDNHFGPELQIGHRLGDFYDEPVLLVKTAWGGKDLYFDFRPPSAGEITLTQNDVIRTSGEYYRKMLSDYSDALSNIETEFPQLRGREIKLSGFFWHQGWNDIVSSDEKRAEYKENMKHLINDLRTEFNVPDLPVVIGESGMAGPAELLPERYRYKHVNVRNAQRDAANESQPASFVPTTMFYKPQEESPTTQGYHWNGNAYSYFMVGDSMGEAMVNLLQNQSE